MPESVDWRALVCQRLAALDLPPEVEGAMVDELAQHLEDRDRELQLSGLEGAAIAALLEAELAARPFSRDDVPGSRPRRMDTLPLGRSRGSWLANVVQDVRYGVRSIRMRPGFAVIVVLTLALGIGANTSIFSIVNALLVRPLPYPRSSELMTVGWKSTAPNVRNGFMAFWSYPRLEILQRENQVFSSVGGYAQRSTTLTGVDNPERLTTEFVTSGYFPALAIAPERGRTFAADEEGTPNSHPVIVISHALWQRRFGGTDSLIGRTVELNKKPFTVVGVMPPGFRGQSGSIDVWIPTMMAPAFFSSTMLTSPVVSWLEVVGRLKPGQSVTGAEAALTGVHRSIRATMQESSSVMESLHLIPMGDYKLDRSIRTSAIILFAAVGFVLLIACVNVANLLLTRAVARRREVGLRVALGATRGRIMQQLLTESLLLACLGGTAGLALSVLAIRGLAVASSALTGSQFGVSASQMFSFYTIRLDANVLAFNFALAIFTGLLFGLVPAWQSSRADLANAIKDGARAGGVGLSRRRVPLRSVLVVFEVAMAVVLLAGAGLMLRSFANLRGVRAGFDASGVELVSIPLTARDELYAELVRRLAASPGIESAGVGSNRPFDGYVNTTTISLDGIENPGGPTGADVGVHYVGGDFFRTLRVPVLGGRTFTEADRADAPRVVIVNAAAARRYWPGQSALGHRLHLDVNWQQGTWAEVVGVVGDVKYGRVEEDIVPDVYLPYRQDGFVSALFVRSALPAAAVRNLMLREAHALDRNIPLSGFSSLGDLASEATARTRYTSTLLAAMAGLALFLAGCGLFAVIYYGVSQRTRELGIRLALGGRRRDILVLVMRQGVALTGIGVIAGMILSVEITGVLRSMLFGVTATDPVTFAAIPVILFGTGLLACYAPARRAVRVDPIVALRGE